MSIETNVQVPHASEIQVTKEETWTIIQVDSQVLSLFMSCPRKYNYVFNRHLIPLEGMSDSIRRGAIIHDAQLLYWKERIKSDDYKIAVQASLQHAQEALNADKKFEPDYKLKTLQSYLEYLRFIQSMSWIPLEAEKYFRVKVFEDENLKLRIYLTGRIDLIVRTVNLPIFPIDFKTETERWFHSQMSNQFRIYAIACGVNLLGVQRIGFQETLKPEDKFKLETIPFDPDILDEWRNETLVHWVKQLIVAHEDDHFPMNTTNCVHGHFKCQFSDAYNGGICNVSRTVREQKIGRYFVVGPEWDPSKQTV